MIYFIIITVFYIVFPICATMAIEGKELSRREKIILLLQIIWLWIDFGLLLISTESIADGPMLFAITATLTLLSALASIAAIFFCEYKLAQTINIIGYACMFLLLINKYNHQPVANVNVKETIITDNRETFFILSDSTRFCDWNVSNPDVFTIIKKDEVFLPSDKCILCGKGVAKHVTEQRTEEEYLKQQEWEDAQPEYYPFP